MWYLIAAGVILVGFALSSVAGLHCKMKQNYMFYQCDIEYKDRLKMSLWLLLRALLAQGKWFILQTSYNVYIVCVTNLRFDLTFIQFYQLCYHPLGCDCSRC